MITPQLAIHLLSNAIAYILDNIHMSNIIYPLCSVVKSSVTIPYCKLPFPKNKTFNSPLNIRATNINIIFSSWKLLIWYINIIWEYIITAIFIRCKSSLCEERDGTIYGMTRGKETVCVYVCVFVGEREGKNDWCYNEQTNVTVGFQSCFTILDNLSNDFIMQWKCQLGSFTGYFLSNVWLSFYSILTLQFLIV